MLDPRFEQTHYMIRKKIFKLVGAAFHIYDPAGSVLFYSKLKAFKLKEDIRLYSGEVMQHELLAIRARNIIDFGAAYDVVDSQTGEQAGTLKRKGFRSMLRDEWLIANAAGQEIGVIQEDSMAKALLRRFLTNLIPQSFTGSVNGATVLDFNRHFNPFVLRMDLDFSADTQGYLDRQLGIAAGVLLSAVEGRQE
ncbi:MAG: hypothetical protein KJ060_01240 [Candidatus Hydrogenedentes bacterium]|nr:hypothetical protein [Candidatus Hydrogenedentota bacterium]